MAWSPYPHWKSLRSLAITSLRKEGMGKTVLEPKILNEAEHYIEHFITPSLGQPFSLSHNLNQATANIISQLLFSKRFEYDDEKFNSVISGIDEALKLSTKTAMIGNLPFGKYFVNNALKREQFLATNVMLPTIQSYITDSKDSIDKKQPRDLIDRFIISSDTANPEEERYFSGNNGYHYYCNKKKKFN